MQGQSALIEPHLNSRQLIYYLVVGNKKAMFVYVITFWTFVQLFRTRHAFTYMIFKWPFVPKPTTTFFTFQIFFWLRADTCINISSVVEFQRWWVLKSKIFAMWWPVFKDFIWFFEMEEHRASEAHKNEFLNYEVLKI